MHSSSSALTRLRIRALAVATSPSPSDHRLDLFVLRHPRNFAAAAWDGLVSRLSFIFCRMFGVLRLQILIRDRPRVNQYPLRRPMNWPIRVAKSAEGHPTRPPEYAFEYVWFDIVIETLTGFDETTCILHFFCPFTKLHVVERLYRKSQVSDRVRDFVTYVERQFGTSVRELHSGNEQSLDNDFRAWASRTGRRLVISAEYSPEQNGTIERAGRTLGETQRYLRIDAKLPENSYPETWTAAAYLRNRTPTRALGWRTPWEALFDWMRAEGKTRSVWTKPVVGHLRSYGSRAYVLDHKVPKGRKSMARAHIGYLVGYESTNIFRVWVPHLKGIFRSRDARFDETKRYDPVRPHIDPQLREEVDELIELIQLPELQRQTSRRKSVSFAKDTPNRRGPQTSTPRVPTHGKVVIPPPEGSSQDAFLPTPEATPEPSTSARELPSPTFDQHGPEKQLEWELTTLVDTNPPPANVLSPLPIPGSFDTPFVESPTPSAPVHSRPDSNNAPRRAEILADISEENIVEGKRHRRPPKTTPSPTTLRTFHTTLSTAFQTKLENKVLHRSDLQLQVW